MSNVTSRHLALLALAAFVPSIAFAGAGANVNACIYLPTAPISPITVNFTAGSSLDHCMNNKGKSNSLTASKAGVTCVSVGYVEGKSSSSGGDTCATEDSIWGLSYAVPNSGYSGSTLSKWSHPVFQSNHMSLKDASTGTVVCGNANLCTSQSVEWPSGTQGPLYIIFQPQARGTAAKSGDQQPEAGAKPEDKKSEK